MPFYLDPEKEDYNRIPELQVCLVEALYDIDSILGDPGACPEHQRRRLRNQIIANLERAWEITGGTADQLHLMLVRISQGVGREFRR